MAGNLIIGYSHEMNPSIQATVYLILAVYKPFLYAPCFSLSMAWKQFLSLYGNKPCPRTTTAKRKHWQKWTSKAFLRAASSRLNAHAQKCPLQSVVAAKLVAARLDPHTEQLHTIATAYHLDERVAAALRTRELLYVSQSPSVQRGALCRDASLRERYDRFGYRKVVVVKWKIYNTF